jgi:transcriptional regulator with XRE-family HTH domain
MSAPETSEPAGDLDISFMAQRLREARARAGLSTRRLAAIVKCSPSLINQIENGKISPSVSTLFGMAAALGLTMDEVFRDREEDGPRDGRPVPSAVLLREHRPVIQLERGVRWERLTPRSEAFVEFLEVHYEPGWASADVGHPNRHNGRDYAVILEGDLTAQIGFERIVLRPGDSCAFDATLPHQFWNEGDICVRAVFVILNRDTPAPVEAGQ